MYCANLGRRKLQDSYMQIYTTQVNASGRVDRGGHLSGECMTVTFLRESVRT